MRYVYKKNKEHVGIESKTKETSNIESKINILINEYYISHDGIFKNSERFDKISIQMFI